MPVFNYQFTVPAPLMAVYDFHHETNALKRLMPPPLFVQSHRFDPLGEGSIADFTIWFGPLPVRWQAEHSQVGLNGFTDRQVVGPLAHWQHQHRFTAINERTTQVTEQVVYEYPAGAWLTPLLFNRPGLTILFTYRQLVTRWALRHYAPPKDPIHRLPNLAGGLALLMIAGLLFKRWLK